MTVAPLVSIVMPLYDDAETVSAAIDSCLRQSLAEIEIICVDDASTDTSAAVVEGFAERDPRVRLIRHDRNLSAFEARRTGVELARAPHILFLDGDDELAPDAAERAAAHAAATDADIVSFGVTVVDKNGHTGGSYERRLQPSHGDLEGTAVLRALFPAGAPAQGQLWRRIYRTRLLRDVFASLPTELNLPRVNDLPLMFLVAARARRCTSIPDRLYVYHLGRGGSGHRTDTAERADFYTSAVRSIDSIRGAVEALSETFPDRELLREAYESARASIIGYVCFQLVQLRDPDLLDGAFARLFELVPPDEVVCAAARFYPRTLSALKTRVPWLGAERRDVRNVLLVTSTLRLGGVSAVLLSQARYLLTAGYGVTVVARSGGSEQALVPEGAAFVELRGDGLSARLTHWAAICREHRIDVVVDHQVLYTKQWPEFALVARAEGAVTIGWLHNFVARPLLDGDDRLSHLERCSGALAHLVVLSPLDVAYMKLRGIEHVSFLPNPPSPLLTETSPPLLPKSRSGGPVELVWWGRLEQRTKRVLDLIEVGAALAARGVDFRLKVIGPGWDDLGVNKFNKEAARRQIGDRVVAIGPLRGSALISAIDASDAFVSTSIIEGYQLTIAEAQSRGLPIFMYELPWLYLVQDNDGVVAVPQQQPQALAARIVEAMTDPTRYADLSRGSIEATQRALSHDFAALYRDVLTGTVSPTLSPEPTRADADQLLGLFVFYAEHSRESERASRQRPSDAGARVWRAVAPGGRALLRRFPGLRPLAHRIKNRLRAH